MDTDYYHFRALSTKTGTWVAWTGDFTSEEQADKWYAKYHEFWINRGRVLKKFQGKTQGRRRLVENEKTY